MGRLASSLVVSAMGFVSAFAFAIGCAGSGETDDVLPTIDGGGQSNEAGGKKLQAPSDKEGGSTDPGDDDTTGDDDDDIGGPTDAGKKDSGVDSGPPQPPAPNEGDPCTTQDQILAVACGFCGKKTTVCEKKPDGSLGWSGYSPCDGEHGECAAGTTQTEECNNCGTRTITCSSACKWTTGACNAPPAAVCSPATYDLTNAGCNGPELGLYRVRQCDPTCQYNAYSGCQSAPTTIEVGRTVGAVSSTITVLGGSIAKISANTCPATIGSTAAAYAYVQVHNPLATDATVIIYNSLAPASTVFDTAIAVYNGDTAPTTAEARRQCVKASNTGNSTYTGDSRFASLDSSTKKVTIPANGTVSVYTTAESASDSGAVRLNVKTDTIAKPPAP